MTGAISPFSSPAKGFLVLRTLPNNRCSPAPGQDCVNSRHTVCRGLHLHKVVRLHQTGSGLQESKKGSAWGRLKTEDIKCLQTAGSFCGLCLGSRTVPLTMRKAE